jgi:hypothetical protein
MQHGAMEASFEFPARVKLMRTSHETYTIIESNTVPYRKSSCEHIAIGATYIKDMRNVD